MNEKVFDDLDLRLIDALQRRPRASWTTLANLLGSSPVTLARRWRVMNETGSAWMTVAPDLSVDRRSQTMGAALVEVNVRPGRLAHAARSLAESYPEIATLEVTSGARDLLLTVIAGDQARLASFLFETLDAHELVDGLHAHPASFTYTDASDWHMRELAGKAPSPPRRAGMRPAVPRRDIAEEIAAVLAQDGRASAGQVAARLGITPRTARAALAALVGSGVLRFRTEIARPLSPWPVCMWCLIESPASSRHRTAAALCRIRESRAVVQTVGQADLAAVMWMRSLTDVQDIELRIERHDPQARVRDRILVLRTVKIMGHLLDDDGHAAGFVPLPAYVNTRS